MADGYPLLGNTIAPGVTAKSCWKLRNYSDVTLGGCGDGLRSCILRNPFNLNCGVEAAASNGPAPGSVVTSQSGNPIDTTNGGYVQDFYYDPSCTAQGDEYLDAHNGRFDSVLGSYTYHLTSTFPFNMGLTYYGALNTDVSDTIPMTCQTTLLTSTGGGTGGGETEGSRGGGEGGGGECSQGGGG